MQRAVGVTAAELLRFVWLTNRFSLDPPNVYRHVEPDIPVIIAFWHGQHLMMPFLKPQAVFRQGSDLAPS